MTKKSFIGKILNPGDSGSILIFLFGLALAGFASGFGSAAANMVFKGTMRKVDANFHRLPPEYRKEL